MAEQQHRADELAEAERCRLQTGPGEHCDYPVAEGGSVCGYHQRQEIRRLAAELKRAQAEAIRLRAELARYGALPLDATFMVYGEPEQLIFRGPTGQVVLRRMREDSCKHCGRHCICGRLVDEDGA